MLIKQEHLRLIGFKIGSLIGVRDYRGLAEVVDQKMVEALFGRIIFERKMESVIERFCR